MTLGARGVKNANPLSCTKQNKIAKVAYPNASHAYTLYKQDLIMRDNVDSQY
jgi:hypothetical protein